MTFWAHCLFSLVEEVIDSFWLLATRGEKKNNQRLLTNSITPINDFLTQTLTKMKIYLEDSEAIGNIKSRLKRNGSSEVSICFLSINDKAHKVELSLGKNFYIDSPILSSIKDISGVSKVEEI